MASTSFPACCSFLGGRAALPPEGCSEPHLLGCLGLSLAAASPCSTATRAAEMQAAACHCTSFSCLYITANLQEDDKALRPIALKQRIIFLSQAQARALCSGIFSLSLSLLFNCKHIAIKLYPIKQSHWTMSKLGLVLQRIDSSRWECLTTKKCLAITGQEVKA